MRFLAWRKTKSSSGGESDRDRILTEYILHMSLTCLGDEDVTPLYEEYMRDSRLGHLEKVELTEAYHSLLPRGPTRLPS